MTLKYETTSIRSGFFVPLAEKNMQLLFFADHICCAAYIESY